MRDHPRVGGGTKAGDFEMIHLQGPSPRGRGNQRLSKFEAISLGTIPAWAGEPIRGLRRGGEVRDHPRVGGGTQ